MTLYRGMRIWNGGQGPPPTGAPAAAGRPAADEGGRRHAGHFRLCHRRGETHSLQLFPGIPPGTEACPTAMQPCKSTPRIPAGSADSRYPVREHRAYRTSGGIRLCLRANAVRGSDAPLGRHSLPLCSNLSCQNKSTREGCLCFGGGGGIRPHEGFHPT